MCDVQKVRLSPKSEASRFVDHHARGGWRKHAQPAYPVWDANPPAQPGSVTDLFDVFDLFYLFFRFVSFSVVSGGEFEFRLAVPAA
jgi:hypothetical protein